MLDKGIATIYVGGYTKTEIREKMLRYEDALSAMQNAHIGIVPGEGIIYLKISSKPLLNTTGEKIIYKALCDESFKENIEQILTKNEMIIFQLLLDRQGEIVTRDALMTALWDNDEFVNDNALSVNISRLRGKLAELGLPEAIETRKKQGYVLK